MERRELPRYPVIDVAATGRNLRRLRLEKGYSVKELQEYLGLSCPPVSYTHLRRTLREGSNYSTTP